LKRLLRYGITFFALCWMSQGIALTKNVPLPADQAFALSTSWINDHVVALDWRIAPGYYLYKEKLRVSIDSQQLPDLHFPVSQAKKDRGSHFKVYTQQLHILIPIPVDQNTLRLRVDYQGCSARGFCYASVHKEFLVDVTHRELAEVLTMRPATSSWIASWLHLLTDQNGVQQLLDKAQFSLAVLIFFILGILLALTPCVWPMVPILLGIIVGQKKSVTTKRAFSLSLNYVLGTAITYAIAGMLAAWLGYSLQAWLQAPWVVIGTSLMFVLLAFSLFGFYELQLPARLQNKLMKVSYRQQGGECFGVFTMGVISALVISPCVTAPLIGVLMYIAQTGDILLGGFSLFVMGLGMGLPLLLIGASAGKWLPKQGRWMVVVKSFVGCLMLVMAVWMGHRVITSQQSLQSTQHFSVIHTRAEFDKQLAISRATNRPILLDFYADWCESCVDMDKHVFSLPDVQAKLSHFILLRADLSANNAEDRALLEKFKVIAPPTVLLFTTRGQEKDAHRIVGEIDNKEFLLRIQHFLSEACDNSMRC